MKEYDYAKSLFTRLKVFESYPGISYDQWLSLGCEFESIRMIADARTCFVHSFEIATRNMQEQEQRLGFEISSKAEATQ